ncbi:MAG: hypothetical protein JRC99_12120 [Deltaproteobacteria bacterium]|nr:hypothetical protein [Deltaproteobacteria bacterium]
MITNRGYWGKGETALEAAKNANVRSSWVHGAVYHAPERMVEGEIEVGDMGSAKWNWREDFYPALKGHPSLDYIAGKYIELAKGELKIIKGELIVKTVIK